MNAHELIQKIHKQLCQKKPNKEECLKILSELQDFCQRANDEEMLNFRKECYGCEMFIMLAKAMEQNLKV